jgi:hypothetical protein
MNQRTSALRCGLLVAVLFASHGVLAATTTAGNVTIDTATSTCTAQGNDTFGCGRIGTGSVQVSWLATQNATAPVCTTTALYPGAAITGTPVCMVVETFCSTEKKKNVCYVNVQCEIASATPTAVDSAFSFICVN